MNPRQRRGALLIALAAVGAAGVLVWVARFVADVEDQVGPSVQVLRLSVPAPAHQPVPPTAVETVTVPQRWAPPAALRRATEVNGLVAAAALPAGTLLQAGMLVPPPALRAGQREITVLVDAGTGVASSVAPGMVVDVFATFAGSPEQAPQATVVVDRARVLAVGAAEAGEAPAAAMAGGELVPVTFAVSVEESLRVAYVESFATKVRLALRAPDDTAPVPSASRSYGPGSGTVAEGT